jgi:hypothetical protein
MLGRPERRFLIAKKDGQNAKTESAAEGQRRIALLCRRFRPGDPRISATYHLITLFGRVAQHGASYG